MVNEVNEGTGSTTSLNQSGGVSGQHAGAGALTHHADLRSPTGQYDRIEMSDVLQVGDKVQDEVTDATDPNSESVSLRDIDSVSTGVPTASTILSPDDSSTIFNFDTSHNSGASTASSLSTTVEIHSARSPKSPASAGFNVSSPGHQIRTSDSGETGPKSPLIGDAEKRNSRDNLTAF